MSVSDFMIASLGPLQTDIARAGLGFQWLGCRFVIAIVVCGAIVVIDVVDVADWRTTSCCPRTELGQVRLVVWIRHDAFGRASIDLGVA